MTILMGTNTNETSMRKPEKITQDVKKSWADTDSAR